MKNVLRIAGYVFIVYFLLSILVRFIDEKGSDTSKCVDKVEVVNDQSDRWHQRSWNTTATVNSFCTSYHSIQSLSLKSGRRRSDFRWEADQYENFWGSVYLNLVEDSKPEILFIVDSLTELGRRKTLNRSELAELVVSFVQDIPYSYVRSGDCAKEDNHGKPCIGNVALGLLSPYEFLHSLYGDCDTRAVLIYALLQELGYDPMIVVSDQYAHAMLALNIPSSGDHLTFRGKKYYFWETTGKGWPLGMLPPNSNNINYWKIALVNS